VLTRVGAPRPAKPAIQVTTDFYAAFSQNSEPPKSPKSSPSTCEPYREQVELGLRLGQFRVSIYVKQHARKQCQFWTALGLSRIAKTL
jgi:hypothetical protein